MAFPKKLRLASVLVIASVGVLVLFAVWQKPHSFVLPDGTRFKLAGVSYGTNQFIYGNALEKILFKLVPGNRIKLGSVIFNRPRGLGVPATNPGSYDSSLNLFFETDPKFNLNSRHLWAQNFRLLAVSDAGETFETAALPIEGAALFCLALDSYPRDEKEFTVKLLRRRNSFDPPPWQTVADFRVENPNVQKPQAWMPQSFPITNRLEGGVQAVLGGVSIFDASALKDNPPFNVLLWFKFYEADGTPASFRFRGSFDSLADVFGSSTGVFGHPYRTNDWTIFRGKYELGTNQVWRLKGEVYRHGKFPPSEVLIFTNIPGTGEAVQSADGGIATARILENKLMISLKPELENSELKTEVRILRAADEQGEILLREEIGGTFTEVGERGRNVALPRTPKFLQVTAAILRMHEVEYYFRPGAPPTR